MKWATVLLLYTGSTSIFAQNYQTKVQRARKPSDRYRHNIQSTETPCSSRLCHNVLGHATLPEFCAPHFPGRGRYLLRPVPFSLESHPPNNQKNRITQRPAHCLELKSTCVQPTINADPMRVVHVTTRVVCKYPSHLSCPRPSCSFGRYLWRPVPFSGNRDPWSSV